MAIQAIGTENDLNFDIGSTYPITISNEQGSSIILCHNFSPNLKIH